MRMPCPITVDFGCKSVYAFYFCFVVENVLEITWQLENVLVKNKHNKKVKSLL